MNLDHFQILGTDAGLYGAARLPMITEARR